MAQWYGCPDESKYEKLAKIGQGTFGPGEKRMESKNKGSKGEWREVFKARDRQTNGIVAMKKVIYQNEEEGFPITTLREIKILEGLKHENIVNLLEVCMSKGTAKDGDPIFDFHLVFEYCDHDLAGLLKDGEVKFSLAEKKTVMQQILNGLHYIHVNQIFHRDLKPANILITKDGVLKLADFGLARAFREYYKAYTPKAITLWYRPPEILLGERKYGPAIDLWGVGCIMAELWLEKPLFQGNTEQTMLQLISMFCGSICPEVWPEVTNLSLYREMNLLRYYKRRLLDYLNGYMKSGVSADLVNRLLALDPAQRIDCDTALDHDFFWSEPLPADLKPVLSRLEKSMLDFLASRPARVPLQPAMRNRHPLYRQPEASAAALGLAADHYMDQIY